MGEEQEESDFLEAIVISLSNMAFASSPVMEHSVSIRS